MALKKRYAIEFSTDESRSEHEMPYHDWVVAKSEADAKKEFKLSYNKKYGKYSFKFDKVKIEHVDLESIKGNWRPIK